MELSGQQANEAHRNLSVKVARAPGHLLRDTRQKLSRAQTLLKETRQQHQRDRGVMHGRRVMQDLDSARFTWLRTHAFMPDKGFISEASPIA